MSQMLQEDASLVDVRSFFVRKRNCLLVRAKFSPLYMDHYLHLMQIGVKHETAIDDRLKIGLAAMVLHLCSRPQDETTAWTVNLHRPLMNLFVTGGSRPGYVTGRVFTEDVRDNGKPLFIAQVTRPHMQPRQSMVEVQGNDILEMIEHFYTQSEQRLTRFFPGPDEELIMISAEPDFDEDWLMSLAPDDIASLGEKEHLTPLESRGYVFHCGGSMDRLYPLLGRLNDDDLEHIFADGVATITCPRCGRVYNTPKDEFQEWQARQK